jgi:hypothetical protein
VKTVAVKQRPTILVSVATRLSHSEPTIFAPVLCSEVTVFPEYSYVTFVGLLFLK